MSLSENMTVFVCVCVLWGCLGPTWATVPTEPGGEFGSEGENNGAETHINQLGDHFMSVNVSSCVESLVCFCVFANEGSPFILHFSAENSFNDGLDQKAWKQPI